MQQTSPWSPPSPRPLQQTPATPGREAGTSPSVQSEAAQKQRIRFCPLFLPLEHSPGPGDTFCTALPMGKYFLKQSLTGACNSSHAKQS